VAGLQAMVGTRMFCNLTGNLITFAKLVYLKSIYKELPRLLLFVKQPINNLEGNFLKFFGFTQFQFLALK
jgi:hypothetical protein